MDKPNKEKDFKCDYPECEDKEFHHHLGTGNVTSIIGGSIFKVPLSTDDKCGKLIATYGGGTRTCPNDVPCPMEYHSGESNEKVDLSCNYLEVGKEFHCLKCHKDIKNGEWGTGTRINHMQSCTLEVTPCARLEGEQCELFENIEQLEKSAADIDVATKDWEKKEREDLRSTPERVSDEQEERLKFRDKIKADGYSYYMGAYVDNIADYWLSRIRTIKEEAYQKGVCEGDFAVVAPFNRALKEESSDLIEMAKEEARQAERTALREKISSVHFGHTSDCTQTCQQIKKDLLDYLTDN